MERPFRLTSDQAEALATEFGTPLYVLSEDVFVESIRAFKSAAAQHLVDHQPRISFATKSNGTLALLQIAYREGCHIDVASEGELRGALRAGVPARECTLHGNNKSEQELAFALDEGIGEIVIDSFDEIRRLLHLALRQPVTCQLTLRVNPHLDLGLNAKVATASVLSKFGFQPRKEEIGEAVRLLAQASLSVTGLHCHLGSQIFSPDAHARAGASLLELMSETPEADWKLLNLGGGFGIPYTNEVPIRIAECLENVSRLKMPDGLRIAFEPGRS